MKEILKIVNYYSLNKRFADEEFVYSICNILIKEGGLSSYINEIQIKKTEIRQQVLISDWRQERFYEQ